MITVKTGELDKLITIEKATVSQDGRGEETETWTTYTKAWAKIVPVRGREYFEAHGERGLADTRIIMRYVSGVTRSMRVSWSGRIYDIQHPLNIEEQNIEMHLMCIERS